MEQIHQNLFFLVRETGGRQTWTILTESNRPPSPVPLLPSMRRQIGQFVHKTVSQIKQKWNVSFDVDVVILLKKAMANLCLKIKRYYTYKLYK